MVVFEFYSALPILRLERKCMKLSKYNVDIFIDDYKSMIYNSLSRKYVIYDNQKRDQINSLLNNLNAGSYRAEDAELLKKLISKDMIIKDSMDELSIIEFNENKTRFNGQLYDIDILPTMDCNFRCVYCYETRKNTVMNDATAAKIIKYINNINPAPRLMRVAWFGGEPLLEFNRIVSLTEQIKSICTKNGCRYYSHITTNGYLLTKDIMKKFKELNIGKVQITLDGTEEYHNRKRPLTDGQGTFKVIKENILKLLDIDKDITVALRINIDGENYEHVEELLDIIPKNERNRTQIMACNIYQNKNKLDLFSIYKSAVDKGYDFDYKENLYAVCEVCFKNGFTITPDGNVIPCTHSGEKGYSYGYINDEGKFIIENTDFYYKIKTVTALKNETCKQCNQLPMCIASCKFKRYQGNTLCMGVDNGGLSLREKILLYYYSDLKHNRIKEADIL